MTTERWLRVLDVAMAVFVALVLGLGLVSMTAIAGDLAGRMVP